MTFTLAFLPVQFCSSHTLTSTTPFHIYNQVIIHFPTCIVASTSTPAKHNGKILVSLVLLPSLHSQPKEMFQRNIKNSIQKPVYMKGKPIFSNRRLNWIWNHETSLWLLSITDSSLWRRTEGFRSHWRRARKQNIYTCPWKLGKSTF